MSKHIKNIESLTKPQLTLLKELLAYNIRGQKNKLGVITSPCPELGSWIGHENFSVNIVKSSVYSLASYGFITFRSFQDFSLRFDYAEITELGKEALSYHESFCL